MAGLDDYRRKRDFTKTDEPDGAAGTRRRTAARGGLLCVQKHAARQLHWDFRLELDGVLKSWAVPKGPSYDPSVRRLAVQVEDHPLEYGDFEGTIPRGEYGGGTVMLWDSGAWEPVGEPHRGLETGELKVRLSGQKLRGGWVLVRTHSGAGDDGEKAQWLLIKERDAEARPGEADPWGTDDRSAASARTMDEIAAGTEPEGDDAPAARAVWHARASELPATVPLSLATLVPEPPDGDAWLHEVKYDGYRIAARVAGRDVRLLSRNGKDWTERFAAVAGTLAGLGLKGTWLDGEMVVFDRRGVSDFHALQASLKAGRADAVTYVVFDLLFDDGSDLRELPLRERKARLERLLAGHAGASGGRVRYSDHIEGSGAEVLAAACRNGLEGVVSKRAGDAYAGLRTRSWLKAKCARRQEFVIGGYTEPAGARIGLGALLLGTYEDGALRFAGRVGTGFDEAALRHLAARLAKLEQARPPFADTPRGAAAREVHWVAPELVAKVSFSEWTADGRLRQPVFRGLREDKAADDVVREGAAASAAATDPPRSSSRPPGGPGDRSGGPGRDAAAEVGGVTITHPDRLVFPEAGITKLQVAQYYDAVGDLLVPHLARRPLTVIRCLKGVTEGCFFQKHVTSSVPRSVARTTVRGADGASVVYPVVDTREALLTMVQNGAVEFHVWGSRVEELERPDVLVFDLDPAPDVPWPQVREAARALRDELARRGLDSFLKTSGGKGLHVVVPVTPGPQWARVAAWTREVVEALVAREPGKYTATMSKAKRGGRVFVDHFRNGRGATSAAPYSLRARPGAPVAMPIAWDELTRTGGGGDWILASVLERIARRRSDPWADFTVTGARQRVPER